MSVSTEYHEIMLMVKALETKIEIFEKRLDSMDRKLENHVSQDRGFGFKNWELLVMGLFTILAGIIGSVITWLFSH